MPDLDRSSSTVRSPASQGEIGTRRRDFKYQAPADAIGVFFVFNKALKSAKWIAERFLNAGLFQVEAILN